MIDSDRDSVQTADKSGGVEGGMANGNAGGPSQADKQRAEANESDGSDRGAARPGTPHKVDLGQGSHEQTQGGAS
jgi:hypothetical protein